MSSSSLKVWPSVSTRYKTSLNFDNEILKSPSLIEQECQICLVEYPAFILVSSCSKGHKFCKTCLELYVKTKIFDFRGQTIFCPQDSCIESCNDNILRVVLNDPEMQLYEERKLEKAANKNPNMKFCPRPGCSRVYTFSESTQYTICTCQSKICNACGELWHEGKTCQQASDSGFDRYIRNHEVKFCIMCKTAVQRTEGCLHMTCPVCDYEWCWSCGREHTPYHQKICPKEWRPEPPKRILDEKKASSSTIFILMIPVKLAFFGFFVCRFWRIMREGEKIITKILVSALAMLVSMGYDALIFTLLRTIVINRNHALIPLLAFILLPFVILIVCEMFKFCFKGKFDKRWKSMNENNFRFVAPKINPGLNLNTHHHIEQNQIPQIGNILDEIFGDEKSQRGDNPQDDDLGKILEGIFDEDEYEENNRKEKSINLESAFTNSENILPDFELEIEDQKELSEIKVI